MDFKYNFLAVLDDNYFQDNAPKYANLIESYAQIIWYRIKNNNFNIENIKSVRKAVTKCPLVISCEYNIALKYGYDGVHLNTHCLRNYNIIRNSTNLIIGYSCHTTQELELINGDYYTLSPVYNTPKEYKVNPIGMVNYNKDKKVFGLGGINLDNMANVCNHYYGVAGIRVIEEIVNKYNG